MNLWDLIKFVPPIKGFALLRYVPFAIEAVGIIAQVDANHDGVLSSEEKLATADKLIRAAYAKIPELQGQQALNFSKIAQDAWNLLANFLPLANPAPAVPQHVRERPEPAVSEALSADPETKPGDTHAADHQPLQEDETHDASDVLKDF